MFMSKVSATFWYKILVAVADRLNWVVYHRLYSWVERCHVLHKLTTVSDGSTSCENLR